MDIFGLIDVSVPTWIPLVLCLLILNYIYNKYQVGVWARHGVPAPPPSAFTGNASAIFDPKGSICKKYAEWQKQYGKIFGIVILKDPVLIVTDPVALKEIFVTDFNNYTDRALDTIFLHPLMHKSILFEKGEDWRRIRQSLTPSFSAAKLKRLTHFVNDTSRTMTNVLRSHAESNTPVDTKTVFSAFSMDLVAGTVFGLKLNTLGDLDNIADNTFFQHARDLFTPAKSFGLYVMIASVFPFMKRVFPYLGLKPSFMPYDKIEYFKELVTKLIKEKKTDASTSTNAEQSSCDMLQLLVDSEWDSSEAGGKQDKPVGKKLTKEEILAQSIIFIVAGFDTVMTALQLATYELARNPLVQDKLMAEIEQVVGPGSDSKEVEYEHCQKLKYMEAVIRETLRLYPPGVILNRQCAKGKTTLRGFDLPPGASINVPVWNVNRDPELFDDPLTFNPDRFFADGSSGDKSILVPDMYLSFGIGPRQCIGTRQAMMQLKIALVHILKEFSIEDALPKNVEFSDITGILAPRQAITLTLKPRY